MPLPFLTKTKTLKASQPTPTQGPNPTLITSETCQSLKTVQKTKRYEFARGFIPDAITILDSDTRHAVYHLSGSDFDDPVRGPSGRSKASCIRLRNARTREILATIRPRRLLRDVVTLHSTTASRVASKKFRMSCVGRTGLLGVLSHHSSSLVHIPNPGNLGLPKDTSLFWKISSDKRSMTFHSSTDKGGTPSSILAHASFAQSIALGKLVWIELTDNVTEMLLVYIIISASIVEIRVRKERQKEEEELYGEHTTHPLWMMATFGASYFII